MKNTVILALLITVLLGVGACASSPGRKNTTDSTAVQTKCAYLKEQAIHGSRPIAVKSKTEPGVYGISPLHLPKPGTYSEALEMTILSEVISGCGAIIQTVDVNKDLKEDVDLVWYPVMLDNGKVYFVIDIPCPGDLTPKKRKPNRNTVKMSKGNV